MVTATDKSFLVSFVINLATALVFLALFVILRRLVPKVYQPRCNGSVNAPPPPGPSLFGWFFTTIRYDDEKLYRTHGLDAVMFVKFLRMMLFISIFVSFYGFVVLFAVNATGENATSSSNSTFHVSGLDSITLSGVNPESKRLIAHTFGVLLNSAIVYYFTYKTFREYMHLRLRFKAARDRIENFSVMVRGVPHTVDDESLQIFFDEIFPGKVVSVIRSYRTRKLDDKLKDREDEKKKIEVAYAEHLINGERPTTRTKLFGKIGRKVDALDFHTERFERYTKEAEKMQQNRHKFASFVFVVFNDMATAAQCSQITLDTYNYFQTEPAPEPRDLVWTQFNIDHHQFMVRKLVTNVIFFFLICFWTIPVTFISALSTLDQLAKIKVFNPLIDVVKVSPIIDGFVQGYLPTLVMLIIFAILIRIITLLVTLSGVYTRSKISRVVMTKFYLFEIFNILLIFSVAGSVIGVLQEVIDKPTIIVNLLANSLPKQGGFFINYVMLLSMSGHTKGLLNPFFLIFRFVKHRFLSKTARQYRDAEIPPPFKYAETYTIHLLVFSILLTYSTLTPFIMAFGMLYFAMAFISNKYNILYVAHPLWEAGGKHWQDVFGRIYVSILLYQALFIGVFGLYKFPAGAIVSVICAISTPSFYWYTRSRFVRTCNYLPQRYAVRRDQTLVAEPNKALLKIPSEDPRITVDNELESDQIDLFGPDLPVYEKARRQVTNVNVHQYYFQPSLVPLSDEPELALAKGKMPKLEKRPEPIPMQNLGADKGKDTDEKEPHFTSPGGDNRQRPRFGYADFSQRDVTAPPPEK
eukprot:Phypoly_transcript_02647.p1 GENE.Phypoly_transcript_02647~~Phypoly_transcript_02647.p1  ORF type:complete len:807 (+),score=114.51 Phypoly_transcript_02647:120-2540(+)